MMRRCNGACNNRCKPSVEGVKRDNLEDLQALNYTHNSTQVQRIGREEGGGGTHDLGRISAKIYSFHNHFNLTTAIKAC